MLLPILIVSLLLSGSTAQFENAPYSPIEVGPGSGSVFVADVNNDGKSDLVTVLPLSKKIVVMLSDGTGFVQAPYSPMLLSYAPGAVKLFHANADASLDICILRNERDAIDIYLGKEAGGFELNSGSPFSALTVMQRNTKPCVHVVDVNADGKDDIVATNGRRNVISTFISDGTGSFTTGPQTTLSAGENYYSVAFEDMNADRIPDAVVATSGTEANAQHGTLTILNGDGSGAFARGYSEPLSTLSDPRVAEIADVNRDRFPDVILTHDVSQVSVLLNDGKGILNYATYSPLTVTRHPYATMVADVNRDKYIDIVLTTVSDDKPFASTVTVLLGTSDGFIEAAGSPFEVGKGAYTAAVGDLNHDDKLDVVTTNFEETKLTVLLGK